MVARPQAGRSGVTRRLLRTEDFILCGLISQIITRAVREALFLLYCFLSFLCSVCVRDATSCRGGLLSAVVIGPDSRDEKPEKDNGYKINK